MVAVVHKNYQFNTAWRCLLARLLLKPRFRFIGVSGATREHILSKGIALDGKAVMALPNCIDVEAIRAKLLPRQEARRYLGLSMEDFVVGTVGRLSPVKDQATLLRAFAACSGAIERARLVLAGDGRLETELKTEAERLGVADSVVFAGHVPDASRVMPAFDVFALTSVSEALPRVVEQYIDYPKWLSSNSEDVELFLRLFAELEFRCCATVVTIIYGDAPNRARDNAAKIIERGLKLSRILEANPVISEKFGFAIRHIKKKEYARLLKANYRAKLYENYRAMFVAGLRNELTPRTPWFWKRYFYAWVKGLSKWR